MKGVPAPVWGKTGLFSAIEEDHECHRPHREPTWHGAGPPVKVMQGDDVVGIVMAVFAAIYLVAVLIRPEKLG